MKKVIRAFSVGLTCVLFAALAACGGGSDPGKGGSGKYAGEVLLITARDSGYGKWMADYELAFEEETGCDVHINWSSTANDEVRHMFSSSSYELDDLYFAGAPDLWLEWAKEGYIVPITGLEDRLRAESANYGVYNGKRYTLDPMFSPYGFVYNQDYLDKIPSRGAYTQGVFPETFEGLIDLCDQVNEMGSIDGKTVKPMSWGGKSQELNNIFNCFWAQGNGGEDFTAYLNECGANPNRSSFINASSKNAMQAMVRLIDSDGTYSRNSIPACGEKNNKQSEQNFLNGECVFCPSGGWFESEMAASITPDTFEYGFAAVPQIAASEKGSAVMLNVPAESFFIPASSPVPDIAMDFLYFLFSEENCVQLHKDLGTPMAFKYTFTEEDAAELNPFAQDVTRVIDENNLVLRGSNNLLYLSGGIGQIYDGGGNSIGLTIFSDKMLKNAAGYRLADVDTILENNYNGYVRFWPNKLKNAGL